MKPITLSLYDLFEKQQRYTVPLFQRRYVWRRERQWAPLWEDVRGRAEAYLCRPAEQVHPHFLGAVVLSPAGPSVDRLPAYEVIDGQQRLTTLQLFIAAARDCAAAAGLGRLAREMGRLSANDVGDGRDGGEGDCASGPERFKVWPTNADREEFAAVMTAGGPGGVRAAAEEVRARWRTPRLAEAYLFFHEQVDAWLGGPSGGLSQEERERRAQALLAAARLGVQLVVIQLEERDNPQAIFETLNARGEPLQASDLVRNLVFHTAQARKEDAERLYREHWQQYDGVPGQPAFWQEVVQQGRLERPRIDLFLFHFLTCKLAAEVSAGGIYEAFRGWWQRQEGSVEGRLAELGRYSEAYRKLLEPDPSTRLGAFAGRLLRMELTTVYPVLLYLLVEAGLQGAELDAALDDLESYLVRRFVVGLETSNYNRHFVGLIQHLRGHGGQAREALRGYLLQGSSPSTRWPGDEEFARAWLHAPAYRRMRSRGTEMVLRALEQRLHTKYQERIEIRDGLTVEHVLPQKWRQHWPAPAASPSPDETPEERRARLLHTFGNLTLLTQALNTKNKNDTYALKRELITQQSALRLNLYFRDVEEWGEEQILERGRRLLEVALELWRFPEGAPQPVVNGATVAGDVGPDVDPEAHITAVAEALRPRLPEGFRLLGTDQFRQLWEQLGFCYFQVRPARWRPSVHYEVRVTEEAAFVDFHWEFRAPQHWPAVDAALTELLPAVREAFPEQAVELTADGWRWLTVRLGTEESPERVASATLRLIERTFERLERLEGVRDR